MKRLAIGRLYVIMLLGKKDTQIDFREWCPQG